MYVKLPWINPTMNLDRYFCSKILNVVVVFSSHSKKRLISLVEGKEEKTMK